VLPPELEAAFFGQQIVFARGRLDTQLANTLLAQLLLMARTGGGRQIELYIDSPGGELGAALSVYDTMQSAGVPISTTCTGTAGGAAVLLLAGGTHGKRMALPHARINLLDETTTVDARRAPDLQTAAAAVRDQSARWRAALLKHVSIPAEALVQELSAPRWLTAAEARSLGLIDVIVTNAKQSRG
jgi:ATP-dependent Clp protease protease subunit